MSESLKNLSAAHLQDILQVVLKHALAFQCTFEGQRGLQPVNVNVCGSQTCTRLPVRHLQIAAPLRRTSTKRRQIFKLHLSSHQEQELGKE